MAVSEGVLETSDIPWDEIQAEWRAREFSALTAAVKGLGGLAPGHLDSLDILLFPEGSEEVDLEKAFAEKVFKEAFDAVAAEGKPLLAFYVYGRCLEKWEESEDYKRIRTVLHALRDVTKPKDPSTDILSIIVHQAQLVDDAMGVEEAMNCSCPKAMAERAGRIVRRLTELLAQEERLGAGFDGLRDVVRSDAQTSLCYFDAIEEVAAAVRVFVGLDAPGPTDFARALETLTRTQSHPVLDDDVYKSELLPHRAVLEALNDLASKPRLRIDAAELVYLYPFALEGQKGEEVDPKETVRLALKDVAWPETALGELLRADLGAHELELNDLWGRELGYSGASIQLPPITVTTTARERLEFRAEVRLSRVGNHHLRVWSRLRNAGLHEVNQALRRGSHGMGAEELHSGETWTKFPYYAQDIIEMIAAALAAKPVGLDATFHVVLAARSISVQRPDGSTTRATLAELTQEVGASLLFRPVQHLTTSLEEWTRHPPPTVTNLLAQRGDTGGLVAWTDNTTVAFMPESPEWLIDEYEEMIEFIASIPPLLTLWENRVWHLTRRVDTYLVEDVLPTLGREFQDVDGSADQEASGDESAKQTQSGEDRIAALYQLHKHVIATRLLESDVRRQLALLGSPALSRTRAQRQFLDRLWMAASLPALESQIEQPLTLLAERQEQMAATALSMDQLIRLKRQEHARRLERPVTFVIGFLAAASLAGVLQWINEAFDVNARFWWAWGEAAILMAVALVVAFVIWRPLRSP